MDFGAVVESYRWSDPNSRWNDDASRPSGSPASPPILSGSQNGGIPAGAGHVLLPLVRAKHEAAQDRGRAAKKPRTKTGRRGNRRQANKGLSLNCNNSLLSRYWSSDDHLPVPLLDIEQPSPACRRNDRAKHTADAYNGRVESEENRDVGIHCLDSAHPDSGHGKWRQRNKRAQLAPTNFDNEDLPIRYWSSDDSLPVPSFDIGAQSAEARILEQQSPSYRRNCKPKPMLSSVEQIVEAKSKEKKTEGNDGHRKRRQRKKATQFTIMNSHDNNPLIPYWSSDDCLPVPPFDIGVQSTEARVLEQPSPSYRRSGKAKSGLPSVEQIVEVKFEEKKTEGGGGHKKRGQRKKATQLTPMNSDNNNLLIQYWSSDNCPSVPSFDIRAQSADARILEQPCPSYRRSCKAKAVPSSVGKIVEVKSMEQTEGDDGHKKRRERKKATRLTPTNSDNNNLLIQYWSSDDSQPVPSFDIEAQLAESRVLATDRRKKPPNLRRRRQRPEPIQTSEPYISTILIPNLQQQPEAAFSLTTPPETVMEDHVIEFNNILNVDWSSDVTSRSKSPKPRKKSIKRSGQSRVRKSLEDNRTKKDENCLAETTTSSPETGSKRRKSIHIKDAIGQRTIVNKDWIPPVSVHALIQEDLYKDPWKVLVACMLLNKTSGAQMRQVIWNLFDLCPSPEVAVAVDVTKIEQVIQPLGLQHKRARMLQRFSHEYLGKDWSNVSELHGIGKYARDAYAIFCEGRWQEVEPEDHKLKDYWLYLHATDGLGYAFHDDRDKS